MKTVEDLNALIPILVEMVRNNKHEIGSSYFDNDEDGWGLCQDNESNYLCYEEDGWRIEIGYECSGEWSCSSGDYWSPSVCDLKKGWGKVTEITAFHFDDVTKDDSEFSDDDVKTLWNAIDKELEDISI